jgi:hypothetical protein
MSLEIKKNKKIKTDIIMVEGEEARYKINEKLEKLLKRGVAPENISLKAGGNFVLLTWIEFEEQLTVSETAEINL